MLKRFLEFVRSRKLERKEKRRSNTRIHAIEKLRQLHERMKL